MGETAKIVGQIEKNMSSTFGGELNKIQTLIKGLIAGLVLLRCLLILTEARRNEQPINAALEQCKKIVLAGIIAAFLPDYIAIISGDKYFGSITLLSQIGNKISALVKISANLIIALTTVLTVWSVVKEGLAWHIAADEQKPLHREKIKKALIIGVLIITGSGILSVIFGYFAVPIDNL